MKIRLTNKWFSLAITLVGPFLVVTDLFVVNIVIPSVKKGLAISNAAVQLIMAAYLLGYAVFLITGARLGDHFGRRKMFRWGMLLFVAASALCALAQSGVQLILFRFVEGVSAALMMSQSIALLQHNFQDGKERNKAFGWYGIVAGMACMTGLLMGGYFTSHHFGPDGWRLAFVLNLPAGITASLLAARSIGETPRNTAQKFDLSGTLILSIGLIAFVCPLILGREYHWPWWSLASIVASIGVMLRFVRHQQHKLKAGQNPLINLQLFRMRGFNIGILTVLFFFGVHNSFILMETIYVQSGLRLDPGLAGMDFAFYGMGFLVSSFISIRYIGRFGKKLLQFGLGVMIFALLMQVQAIAEGTGFSASLPLFLLVYGLGQGLVMPSLLNIALKGIPAHFTGMAAGVYSTMQQLASALGVTFIGGLFFYVLQADGGNAFRAAFRYGLYADMAYLLIAFVLLHRINREPAVKKITTRAKVCTE